MLDYYGSIEMNENDIIIKILDSYQGKNYKKEHLEKIIKDFMDGGKLIVNVVFLDGWFS